MKFARNVVLITLIFAAVTALAVTPPKLTPENEEMGEFFDIKIGADAVNAIKSTLSDAKDLSMNFLPRAIVEATRLTADSVKSLYGAFATLTEFR